MDNSGFPKTSEVEFRGFLRDPEVTEPAGETRGTTCGGGIVTTLSAAPRQLPQGGSPIRAGASCKQASHYGRGGTEGDGEGTVLLPKGRAAVNNLPLWGRGTTEWWMRFLNVSISQPHPSLALLVPPSPKGKV